MPIYIPVEVARRELEARLLLGLVAAERGHDVVLGKIPHRALLDEALNGWRLPPGILHLKSVASSPDIYGRLDALRTRGTRISAQDEEHGLSVQTNYADFARLRFPEDGVQRIDRLMAWGPVDAAWFRDAYPERPDDVVVVGSPRLDLWRPDVIDSAPTPAIQGGRGKTAILIASSLSPFSRNPFWVHLYNAREGQFGSTFKSDSEGVEALLYEEMSDAFRYIKHLSTAIRRLALAHPDRTIVVRPHHFEIPDAWDAVLGKIPNVVVRADGSARAWVQDAAVVVHGGSTLAIEATVARCPVVAFTPEGILEASPANRLGKRAGDVDELLDVVAVVLAGGATGNLLNEDATFLSERLAALDGPLAADRIVDEWERMLTPAIRGSVERIARGRSVFAQARRPLRPLRSVTRHVAASRRAFADVVQRREKGPFAMEVEHKFPSLDVEALVADATRLSEHLGRFKDVEIVQIGEREVLLRVPGR